jgi:hypothetical protein
MAENHVADAVREGKRLADARYAAKPENAPGKPRKNP